MRKFESAVLKSLITYNIDKYTMFSQTENFWHVEWTNI